MSSIELYLSELYNSYKIVKGSRYLNIQLRKGADIAKLSALYLESPLPNILTRLSNISLNENPEIVKAITSDNARYWLKLVGWAWTKVQDFDGTFLPRAREEETKGSWLHTRDFNKTFIHRDESGEFCVCKEDLDEDVICARPNIRALRTMMLMFQMDGWEALENFFDLRYVRDYGELIDILNRCREEQKGNYIVKDYHFPESIGGEYWKGVYPRYEDHIFGVILTLIMTIIGTVSGELIHDAIRTWWDKQKQAKQRPADIKSIPELKKDIRSEVTAKILVELVIEAISRRPSDSTKGTLDEKHQKRLHANIEYLRSYKGTRCPEELREADNFAKTVGKVVTQMIKNAISQEQQRNKAQDHGK